MEDWQERVIDEATELTKKILKLAKFMRSSVFDSLDEYDQKLLQEQFNYMKGYSYTLVNRIDRFIDET